MWISFWPIRGELVTISSLSTEGEEKKRSKKSTTISFLDRRNSVPLAVRQSSNSLDSTRFLSHSKRVSRLTELNDYQVRSLLIDATKSISIGYLITARRKYLYLNKYLYRRNRVPPERIRYLQAQLNTMTRGHWQSVVRANRCKITFARSHFDIVDACTCSLSRLFHGTTEGEQEEKKRSVSFLFIDIHRREDLEVAD